MVIVPQAKIQGIYPWGHVSSEKDTHPWLSHMYWGHVCDGGCLTDALPAYEIKKLFLSVYGPVVLVAVTWISVHIWLQSNYCFNEFDIHKYSLCPYGCRMNSCLVPRSHHISTVAQNGHIIYWSREELLHFYITWRDPEKEFCLWPLDATKSYTPVH